MSHYVVDHRERYMEYWTPFSDTHHPREHNSASKCSIYHQLCALPTKKALVLCYFPYYILPKFMFPSLPHDVIRSTARFRLRVHNLRFSDTEPTQLPHL